MKILKISRNKLEMTRAHMRRPLLTIGRSPACDVLLRAPGVLAVHFVIEWIGDGVFDPNKGAWSIVDISKSIGELDSGTGLVLSEDPIQLGDLNFTCVDDPLESKETIGGMIKESLSSGGGGRELLEVIQVRSDSGAVEEVSHIPVPKAVARSRRLIQGLPPEFRIEWQKSDSGEAAKLFLEEMPGAELFSRGVKVDAGKSYFIKPNEVILVRWKGRDFYVRFVAEVVTPEIEHEVIGDPLLKRLAAIFISLAILLLLLIRVAPPGPEKKDLPPPRIARVEVVETRPPPPPEPEKKPEPLPTPVPTPEKLEERKEPEHVMKTQTKQEKPGKAAKAKMETPDTKPKAGLNTRAPISNVNTVGILGALSKAGSKGEGVSADKVLSERIADSNAGAQKPRVVLPNPPAGTLGTGTGGTPSGDARIKSNLGAASTTLSGAGKYDPNSVGAIARRGGESGLNVGSSANNSGTGVGSGTEVGALGSGEFSVEGGGLDRETVRHVIASYRGEIRTCYERALLSSSRLEGRVVYDWRITPAGEVKNVLVMKSTLTSPSLITCVQTVLQRMAFPRALNGRSTRVIYPFVFQGRQ